MQICRKRGWSGPRRVSPATRPNRRWPLGSCPWHCGIFQVNALAARRAKQAPGTKVVGQKTTEGRESNKSPGIRPRPTCGLPSLSLFSPSTSTGHSCLISWASKGQIAASLGSAASMDLAGDWGSKYPIIHTFAAMKTYVFRFGLNELITNWLRSKRESSLMDLLKF